MVKRVGIYTGNACERAGQRAAWRGMKMVLFGNWARIGVVCIIACIHQLSAAPAYRLPASFHIHRGKAEANATAIFGEVCIVSPWHNKEVPEAVALAASKGGAPFIPEFDYHHEPHMCSDYLNARAKKTEPPVQAQVLTHTASCVSEKYGAVYPCPGGGYLNSTPNKYCHSRKPGDGKLNANETDWMNRCPRISVPILLPGLEEWFVHPENINHVGRDLVFIASMMNLGRKNGFAVMLPGPMEESFKKMNSWGKSILKALQRRGLRFEDWTEEADRFAKVSMRLALHRSVPKNYSTHISHPHGRDVAMHDLAPCGVVCATAVGRLGSTFVEPDDAKLLQQAVLEYCNLPTEPPAWRTLLLIARKRGGTRALNNLEAVRSSLEAFAKSYALNFVTVNFGDKPFCEQLRLASEAYIMVGIQGADPSNMLFQHVDAALIEMYGREPSYWSSSSPERQSSGISTYLQQLAGAGRTGVAAMLFNVTNCDGNWMYNARCQLDLDAAALIAVIKRWVPKPKGWGQM